MKYNNIFNSVREYRAPEVAVVEFSEKSVILVDSMIEDYDENIIC